MKEKDRRVQFIEDVFDYCLFDSKIITTTPLDVSGINYIVGFNPDKVNERKEDIISFVKENVRRVMTYAESFIQLSYDKKLNTWCDLIIAEKLAVLSVAVGIAKWVDNPLELKKVNGVFIDSVKPPRIIFDI